MNFRFFVLLAIFIYAIVIAKTFSIVPFIAPCAILILIAGSRDRSEDFHVMDMFWIMSMIFFVLDPAKTFNEPDGSYLFSGGVVAPYGLRGELRYEQWHIAVMSFLLLLTVLAGFIILPRRMRSIGVKDKVLRLKPWVCICILLIVFFSDVMLRGGFSNVLAARFLKDKDAVSMISLFTRAAFVAFSLICLTLPGRDFRIIFLKVITLIFCAVLFNPFNTSRFALIQMWMPILLIVAPFIRKYNIMAALIAFGAIFLMPILSYTTRFGLAENTTNANTGSGFIDFLDVTRCLIHLIDMVGRQGYEFGASTLSVLLFFVPRSVWPDKPEVVALHVGSELYGWNLVGTDNLSGPLTADFYLDFGIVGVFFGAIFASLILRWMIEKSHTLNGIPVYGFMLASQIPILMRGSVGAVIGPALFSLIFYFVIIFMVRHVKITKMPLPYQAA